MTVIVVVCLVWLAVVALTLALLRMAAMADRHAECAARRQPQRAAAEWGSHPVTVRNFTAERRSGAGDRRVASR